MGNDKNPKITVLMPVYNCELYIRESIESILNQTFDDFEFLIIDDASTDKTLDIIKTYDDKRIKVIKKTSNTGLTNSLNYGLSIAKGEYIARMDGDDISLIERFAKQVFFLDRNPDTVLCGSFFKIIGTDEIITVPENHEDIKLAMLKACCIGHPTVMIRKSYLDKFSLMYDVNKEPTEDYDFWTKLLKVGKLYNIQEILLNYRVHDSQVSKKRNLQQINMAIEIKINLLNNLGFVKNDYTQDLLKKVISRTTTISFKELNDFLDLKSELLLSNNEMAFFDKKLFEQYLLTIQNNLFKDYFLKTKIYKPKTFFQYLKIKKKCKFKLALFHEFKLAVKSIIFYKK